MMKRMINMMKILKTFTPMSDLNPDDDDIEAQPLITHTTEYWRDNC